MTKQSSKPFPQRVLCGMQVVATYDVRGKPAALQKASTTSPPLQVVIYPSSL